MCEPTTLMMASMAVSAIGTAYTGFSSAGQAAYQSRVASNNAKLSREQAVDTTERGLSEQLRQGREVAGIRSAQIAAFAANGIDPSAGSAADVIADTDYFGKLDQLAIQENAGREVRGHLIDAQNFQEEARAQRRQANQLVIGTTLKVGADILGGSSQIAGMKPLPSAKSGGATGPIKTGYASVGAMARPRSPGFARGIAGAPAWGAR